MAPVNVSPRSKPRAVVLGCRGQELLADERHFFAETDPAGFILFRRNCGSPNQVRRLVQALRASVGRAHGAGHVRAIAGRVSPGSSSSTTRSANICPIGGTVPVKCLYPPGGRRIPTRSRPGLDLSVRALTDADRQNITAWYERTIGYVPKSVQFAIKFHPEFYKWHRARWEVIFQKLPKQTAPYVMIRQHMLTNNRDALREAVALGKAWGITREWMALGFATTAYYTGFEAERRLRRGRRHLADDELKGAVTH